MKRMNRVQTTQDLRRSLGELRTGHTRKTSFSNGLEQLVKLLVHPRRQGEDGLFFGKQWQRLKHLTFKLDTLTLGSSRPRVDILKQVMMQGT